MVKLERETNKWEKEEEDRLEIMQHAKEGMGREKKTRFIQGITNKKRKKENNVLFRREKSKENFSQFGMLLLLFVVSQGKSKRRRRRWIELINRTKNELRKREEREKKRKRSQMKISMTSRCVGGHISHRIMCKSGPGMKDRWIGQKGAVRTP